MATGTVKTFEASYTRYVTNIGNVSLYMQLKMTQTYDIGTGKSTLTFSDFKLKQSGVVNNTTYVMGEIKATVNGVAYQIFYDADAAASAPMYRVAINSSSFSVVQFASGSNSGSDWTYTLSDLAHAADGSLSVAVEWTDITVANYLNGYKIKVSGSETVALTKNPLAYALSITAGTGSAITVTRSGSALANGAAIYHGDVLTVSFAALTGYKLTSTTVNGSASSGGSITVSGDVTIVAVAAVLAFSLNLQFPAKAPTVVTRKSSPLKGAGLGELSHGSTIYYGDVLNLAVTIPSGYAVTTTINGAYAPPNTDYTVTGAVVIIVTAKAQGFISVADGNAYVGYQPTVGGAVYIAKIT